jgi:general secretion pathway protein D
LGDLVIKVMGAGGIKDLELVLRAAASHGDVTIVSRPAVIAANNEQAQILVGSQRPFVQVSRSLPTDAASRDQVVQYKDVGTKLSVRPTISSDGYVMLEVTQEISQATSEVQFNAPIISTRSVQTRLLLKDGQTVVIGGLRDRQHEVTRAGVPFLSSIPIIGGLFGREIRTSNATELFLFITPRILRTDDDAKRITQPAQDRATEVTKPPV